MDDKSLPMRVEESNQCKSPISIARERSSYSKRFVKLLQDFQHFIIKLDFLGLFFPTSIRLVIKKINFLFGSGRNSG